MFAYFDTVVELPGLFEFGTSGTDDVEAAGVTVLVDDGAGEFLILAVDETGRTAEEAVELVVGVQCLQTVVETADNVVTAGSLTAGEDDADVNRFGVGIGLGVGVRLERDKGQTVGVREEFLDFLLVSYGVCFLAFNEAYCALQCHRHLRLISLTGDL